jgi:hypothetical protein
MYINEVRDKLALHRLVPPLCEMSKFFNRKDIPETIMQ